MVEFYEKAITLACHKALEQLRHYSFIEDFYLAGGTALAYFDDAEQQPMPRMLKPVRWAEVTANCESAARQLVRRLSKLD